MIAPIVLGALAAGTATLAPEGRARVAQLLPRPAPPQVRADGPAPALVHAAALLAGVALWWLLGGLLGMAAGALAALQGPGLLGHLRHDESDDEASRQLPLALDLLAACLVGGATPRSAAEAVAQAVSGVLGGRLRRVVASLDVGSPAAEAWLALGSGSTPAGAAGRALARAAEGGASVAPAVLRVAEDARRESLARSGRAARRAGVLAVGPLGGCFLPAFLLLGVVPAVVGLAGPLLGGL